MGVCVGGGGGGGGGGGHSDAVRGRLVSRFSGCGCDGSGCLLIVMLCGMFNSLPVYVHFVVLVVSFPVYAFRTLWHRGAFM